MQYAYAAKLEPEDGGFLVTFADVPEAITQGDDWQDAIASAQEALSLALRGIVGSGRELPEPKASDGVFISVDPEVAIKLAVVDAFRKSGISKSELARRLGKSEGEARRILDPDHGTKLGQLNEAMRVLGKDIVISVHEAA